MVYEDVWNVCDLEAGINGTHQLVLRDIPISLKQSLMITKISVLRYPKMILMLLLLVVTVPLLTNG